MFVDLSEFGINRIINKNHITSISYNTSKEVSVIYIKLITGEEIQITNASVELLQRFKQMLGVR